MRKKNIQIKKEEEKNTPYALSTHCSKGVCHVHGQYFVRYPYLSDFMLNPFFLFENN